MSSIRARLEQVERSRRGRETGAALLARMWEYLARKHPLLMERVKARKDGHGKRD